MSLHIRPDENCIYDAEPNKSNHEFTRIVVLKFDKTK